MEFCTSCGTKLAEGAEQCANCGSAVEAVVVKPDQPSFLAPADQTPYPVQESKNGLALAAMILGIVGVALFWTIVLGVVLGVLALIFGLIGRKRAQTLPQHTNSGKAMSGIILGTVSMAASLLFLYAIRDDIANVIEVRDVEINSGACDSLGLDAQVRWSGDGVVDVTLEGQAISSDGDVIFSDEIVVRDLSATPQTVTIDFPSTIESNFDACKLIAVDVE